MNLYQKLFGLNLMAPVEDGGDGGGASADRGDNIEAVADAEGVQNDEQLADDVALATGEEPAEEGEQPRDAAGKFAKKDKEASEPHIPKSRFDDAVRRERERAEAAERRIAEIEQSSQRISRTEDIAQLEQQVRAYRVEERKALVAGDDAKAAEFGSHADALNRQIAVEQARDMSSAAKEQAREEIRWDLTLEQVENDFPTLNPEAEEFDQDTVDDVVDKMNGYMQRERLTRSKALLKAVAYVTKRDSAEAPEKKGGIAASAPGADRKAAAVAKNLDAASRQPASSKKVGADSDKHGQTKGTPDAADMTFEEFSALPESTKAQMRGDHV